ncbi:MAG: hypothetical protein LBN27_11360 [Prevotellaceae bacterium]|jgi:hypothetical protein|nr:hypothetical protein [Prevotellaceae bacterium]
MKKVILSDDVKRVMDNYFESYRGNQRDNDMWKRASNYSKIRQCLVYIDVFLDNTYERNGKNFIYVKGICIIEFALKNDEEILVENIYFENN